MNQSSRLPVGLFDSGMGGLTVLKALNRRLPGEDLLYLGDTARLPYGTKGPDTIVRYTLKAAQKLVDMGVKMLVVACNTATAAALPVLREHFAPLPVLGVVEPGAQAAAQASRNGHIVVLGTEATINGGAYQQAIARIRPEAVVMARACNLFVSLAEEGWMDGLIAEAIAERYLAPVLGRNAPAGQRPDCIVLGCTHFPLLAAAIKSVAGDITMVDSAATTALAVQKELARLGLLRPELADEREAESPLSRLHFLTTDAPQRFARVGSLFLGMELDPDALELVTL